ncbi:MAG: LPS export ABC transporter periplasmic protein LptC [Deltaproteobacteria bacterium]|nr:MAG: LPS export ABC transporter periplasmic protein LptC [Deltaproteobacteria bacterium]
MKLSKLIILILMGLILSVAGGYLLIGRQGSEEEILPTTEAKADLFLEEVHYVETKGEKKEWELRAKSAHHFLQEESTLLKDLRVTFFAEGGRIVTLSGEEGSIKRKKEIEVHGNVVVTSSDGYRVVTDSLYYDEERRQIYTDDPVLIERAGMRVKGIGILVDIKKGTLSIQKEVETVIEG